MTMVSELVLTRNQLLEIVRRHAESEFKAPLQRLSNVTAELQEGVMKTRMQPIGNAWQKLPRVVRDLSTELGKHIDLEMLGAETELDRQVLDLIKDPLTHMVRNSADHGLETPAERRAAGKPERGRIRLSAYHEGGFIVIQIADDGRGLDTARIKAKAIAQGLVSEADAEKLTEAQIHKFIFAPGFSTASMVTNISGRGVGMDVVRNNIDQIGGAIDVKSVAGAGLSFTIKIPLTLAIVAALIVQAGGDHFAIPQLAVVELVRARSGTDHRIERIRDTAVLRLRDKLLPLARLTTLLGMDDKSDLESGYIVVAQVGSQTFGVVVDGVFHTEEIVVKPMSSKLRHIAMFSGNTILGDGSVIMIVDPNGIAQAIGSAVTSQMAAAQTAEAERREAPAEQATSLLVFRAGASQAKAVPLSLITRLEEVDARTIELSNGRHMVQYRGQLMPLVRMNESVRVKGEGAQPLLVFSDGARSMALVVDEIVDIVEDRLDIQVASDNAGVLGSAIVKGQATEIIDVGHFLPLAFEDWFRRKEAPARAKRADGAAGRRLPVLPQHADAGAAGRRLQGDRRRLGGRGAFADQGRRRLRHRHHRRRDAGDGRLPVGRDAARRRTDRRAAGDRARLGGVGRSDRARPPRRLPRFRRQIRPPGPDRFAQGAKRTRPGGLRGGHDRTQRGQLAGIRHRHHRQPAVRPADPARAGRVHAGARDAGAAGAAGNRRRAQYARAHRDADRHAPAARPAGSRRERPGDGDRRRVARGILRPADRRGRRGAQARRSRRARRTRSISTPSLRACRPASTGSTASC